MGGTTVVGEPRAATPELAVKPPILHLRNLVKRRGRGGIEFELQVPDMQLFPGQFVAVLGESGCGKSTLLDMLALVLQPTSSEIFQLSPAPNGTDGRGRHVFDVRQLWLDDNEAELAEIRRAYFGYVLQTGGLFPFLTIRDNIILSAQVKGIAVPDGEVERLAKGIGITPCLGRKPQFVSGGQRQRAAILRAVIHQPSIIVADEPTAAVDKPRAREIVRDFAQLARARSATIVMVTHDPGLVAEFADASFGFEIETVSDALTVSRCRLTN